MLGDDLQFCLQYLCDLGSFFICLRNAYIKPRGDHKLDDIGLNTSLLKELPLVVVAKSTLTQ